MRSRFLIGIGLLTLLAVASAAGGAVYRHKEEALALAFPGAERIAPLNLYLSDAELEQVRSLSGVRPDSSLYSFYVASKGETVLGYAAIEAATVRTLPETVLVVLEPDGRLRSIEILAFFEPEEYKPSERWLRQFAGRSLSPQLRVGGDIHALTGATLSAQAITRQARKSAAILSVHLQKERP